jgi:MoaA/NifB/PqqE/SkfB family radical SAM enzyme
VVAGAAVTSPYAVNKLAWHPDVLAKLRRGEPVPPLLVQWFLTNICNQSCSFCSYGSGPEAIRATVPNPPKAAWKNQHLGTTRDAMPLAQALATVDDLITLGVAAIEFSGGGEPLAYPHLGAVWARLARPLLPKRPMPRVALVTNGTLLSEARLAALVATRLAWVRVSIDAGSVDEYVGVRRVPAAHWDAAWSAVRRLAAVAATEPDYRVGVGYTVDHNNGAGVGNCIQQAFDAGADNVRVSLAFTPDGVTRWAEAVDAARRSIDGVQHLIGQRTARGLPFAIANLLEERRDNVVGGWQQYPTCLWKDVGCVIGADQNVYACCSWAYNPAGLIGSLATQGFRQLWEGDAVTWQRSHDPRRHCHIHCLYEARNIEALKLVIDPAYAEGVARADPPAHVDFV